MIFVTNSSLARKAVMLVMLAMLGVHALPGYSADKDGQKKQKRPKELVWPLPPETPRLRFVQEIHGTEDVEPSKKQGALERLSGVKRQQFKPYFNKPFGVAVDSKSRIFVSDNGQAMVFVFDCEHHQVSYIGVGGP